MRLRLRPRTGAPGPRHRRTATDQPAHSDQPASPTGNVSPPSVYEFVRTHLPQVIRAVTNDAPLPADAPAEAHQAAWQIAASFHRAQAATYRELLASLEPLLGVLTEQRRCLDQRHAHVTDPAQLETVMAIDHANAQALRGVKRAVVLAGGAWPQGRRGAVPLEDISFGESAGADDGCCDAGEGGEVVGLAFVAAVEPAEAA